MADLKGLWINLEAINERTRSPNHFVRIAAERQLRAVTDLWFVAIENELEKRLASGYLWPINGDLWGAKVKGKR